MPSKRDLGVSYLLGTGLGLIAVLTWFFLLVRQIDVTIIVPTVTAGILSGTFVFVGYWMFQTGISEDVVWTVARWSAIGLTVPGAIGVYLLSAPAQAGTRSIFPGLFVNLIAVGGVIGLLVGLVLEMHREQGELKQLNRRNKVLNRVLRHNIRNDMSVMRWHVDLLADTLEGDQEALESIDALRQKIDEVIDTSDAARRIDHINHDRTGEGPIDVVRAIEERVAATGAAHPDATLELDLPERAMARVGSIFETALDNLIENAIEHHDGEPTVSIGVTVDRESSVLITIEDDGPGVPDSELATLRDGQESQMDHGAGLGLWLVRWIVDHYDGSLDFERLEPRGTRAVIEVPAATDVDAVEEGRPALDAGGVRHTMASLLEQTQRSSGD